MGGGCRRPSLQKAKSWRHVREARLRQLPWKGRLKAPCSCSSGDGGPAVQARLRAPSALARSPHRGLYLVNDGPRRVRRIGAALSGFSTTDIARPSEDGRALYVFDASGRHLRSQCALTGATLVVFEYDARGPLARGGAADGERRERDGDRAPWSRQL